MGELPTYLKAEISDSQNQLKSNKQFFKKLKKHNPRKLDSEFHKAHVEVFNEIDCLKCANCCKTTSPIFYESDISRLAKYLRIKPSVFISKYLKVDDDKDYVLNTAPCPFLAEDNYCSVYASRPAACREYPHTNRKKMYQILNLTLRNTLVCPAVSKIVKSLRDQHPAN